jgi:catechol 2,3-dioxygenase-like lactoylglutathione lyase family enzyme
VKFNHVAVTVADVDRSIAFYTGTLGMQATVRQEGRDYLLIDGDGFVLGLLAGTPSPSDAVHFGFELPTGDAVRKMRRKLNAGGVTEVQWLESEDFVAMKFLDPDGYVVEVFWE